MRWRLPLAMGFVGVVISIASFVYTTADARYTSTDDGAPVAVDADQVATPETVSHEVIRYANEVLNPGILIIDQFSNFPDIVASQNFNRNLRLFTLFINFVLYYFIGYVLTLIFSFIKSKSLNASLRG